MKLTTEELARVQELNNAFSQAKMKWNLKDMGC